MIDDDTTDTEQATDDLQVVPTTQPRHSGEDPYVQNAPPVAPGYAESLRSEREADDGRSFQDMEGDDDEEQQAMFPLGTLDGDPKVTMKNIIKGNLPVEVTVKMRGAELPLKGGLIAPDEITRLFVSAEVFSFKPVPQRDKETRDIIGWKIAVELRPTYVERAESAMADPATALAS